MITLESFIEIITKTTIHILELIGIFIIGYSSLRGFGQYLLHKLKFDDTYLKIEIAKGLALGLEFKLGGEILRTILVRTIEEIKVLGAIIILRVILTFVIHWEISSELQDHQLNALPNDPRAKP